MTKQRENWRDLEKLIDTEFSKAKIKCFELDVLDSVIKTASSNKDYYKDRANEYLHKTNDDGEEYEITIDELKEDHWRYSCFLEYVVKEEMARNIATDLEYQI